MREENWWKKTVVYQIYPKSFQDSNGDGIGDIPGIIRRLPYLKELGIGCIWLCPMYRSPQDDNGYDIADYCDIDPMFGTMADMEQLIQKADECGIAIVMDLVLNHSSDEHPWFVEAKKSRSNPYHDYYVWRDGTEDVPPNDMRATFGGSAWEWVPELKQYYFHQFSVKQPDLNWDNPKLRQELYKVIRFWMDKGVGGFRLDVIDQIAKEPDKKITANGPRLHEFIQEMNRESFGGHRLMTVGEAWSATPELTKRYSNPDGSEFSMVFQFEHIGLDQQEGKEKWDVAPLSLLKLKKVLEKWQTELADDGWNSLFWNNHDLPRIVSRWGNDGEYRVESAKMLALLLHGMKGTPYIFQGEELGMTNVHYDISEYRDIETLHLYRDRIAAGYSEADVMASIHAKSRDNARTPMQWDATKNAGFTDGEPWIRVNPNYMEIHAEGQPEDAASIFSFYKTLIALRKTLDVFVDGSFTMLDRENESVFAYRRNNKTQELTVVCNFTQEAVAYKLPDACRSAELLLCNYAEQTADGDGMLRPYEARLYLRTCE